jgi:beta-fructofuranosidase
MIFRPKKPACLWDTWLFEWQGLYHLYYLETQKDLWDHVGHAVSTDLIHWKQCQSIYTKGASGNWNEEATLTGMVVPHEGKFYMFVGATWNKVQVVGVYTSTDLYTWTECARNPIMKPKPPYMTHPCKPFDSVDWRDPCIQYRREDGFYHALLCARQNNYSHADTGAVIAHLRSKDLLNWEYLPKLDADVSGFYHTEVPDIFFLNGKYYLMFSTMSVGGLTLDSPSRDSASGAFYMIGDSIDGPFKLPSDYILMGSSDSKMGPYVARTIPYRDKILLYHHIKTDTRPAFCSPKLIAAYGDNSLYLQYMPILEKLEKSVIISSIRDIAISVNDLGDWQSKDTCIIGIAQKLGSGCGIAQNVSDVHFYCKLRSLSASKAGIAVRCTDQTGVLLTFDFANNRILIGISRYNTTLGWGHDFDAVINHKNYQSWDICKRKLDQNKNYALRVFVRDEFFEVYIDDIWISTVALEQAPKAGDIHLVVEKGEAVFSHIRLAEIEALE